MPNENKWVYREHDHNEFLVQSEQGDVVALVYSEDQAKLIAACPDLLKAAKEALRQLEYASKAVGIRYPARDKLERAIAKAGGQNEIKDE